VRSDLRAQRSGQLPIMQESDSAAVNPNHLARKLGHTLAHAASAMGGGGGGGGSELTSVLVAPPASRTVVATGGGGGGLRVEMPVRGRGAAGARAGGSGGGGGGGGGGGMFSGGYAQKRETVFRVRLDESEGAPYSGGGGEAPPRVSGSKGRRRDEEDMEGEAGPRSAMRAPPAGAGGARARGRGAQRARTEAPDAPAAPAAAPGGGGGGGGGGEDVLRDEEL
jgi:hypothetical protein